MDVCGHGVSNGDFVIFDYTKTYLSIGNICLIIPPMAPFSTYTERRSLQIIFGIRNCDMSPPYESRAALRTFELFETFAAAKKPLALSELAEQMQIPVSSCFGLVTAARSRGYVYPIKPRGPIYPTKRMLELAQTIAAHDPVGQRVVEVLKRLRDVTEETAVFGKCLGNQVLYLDAAPSPHRIRYTVQIGETREMHASSMGKALLAMMSPTERAKVLQTLSYRGHTPQTLVTAEALNADIERGRQQGWQETFAESTPDSGAIACGVEIQGEPYALCVAGPLNRMVPKYKQHAVELRKACDEISDSVQSSVN